jgi:hypothetical protein
LKLVVTLAAALVVIASAGAAEESVGSAPAFARARYYGTGPDPESVAIGDLNGDGRADLATANNGSVSVLLNEWWPVRAKAFVRNR